MSKRVYVLGAGFTRAFLPKSPLLKDEYGAKELLKKYKSLEVLQSLIRDDLIASDGKTNLERLMTRLDGGMPYDDDAHVRGQHQILLHDLKQALNERIRVAMADKASAELDLFAIHCVQEGHSCITFNYDDALDRALWQVQALTLLPEPKELPYWHPDGGYGFFCPPSRDCIQVSNTFMDIASCILLKLHGSVNWRIRRGSPKPHGINAIVHNELWMPTLDDQPEGRIDLDAVDIHLEPDPFLVPPVLTKSSLVEQPILRTVWSLAYKALKEAKEVVFIGYSMPLTDIAAGFLFREALSSGCKVMVVDLRKDEQSKRALRDNFHHMFAGRAFQKDMDFFTKGAVKWVRREIGAWKLADVIPMATNRHGTGMVTHGVVNKASGDLLRTCNERCDLDAGNVDGIVEVHHGDVPQPSRIKGDAGTAYFHRRDPSKGNWALVRKE